MGYIREIDFMPKSSLIGQRSENFFPNMRMRHGGAYKYWCQILAQFRSTYGNGISWYMS